MIEKISSNKTYLQLRFALKNKYLKSKVEPPWAGDRRHVKACKYIWIKDFQPIK